jgi:hypothetical protein
MPVFAVEHVKTHALSRVANEQLTREGRLGRIAVVALPILLKEDKHPDRCLFALDTQISVFVWLVVVETSGAGGAPPLAAHWNACRPHLAPGCAGKQSATQEKRSVSQSPTPTPPQTRSGQKSLRSDHSPLKPPVRKDTIVVLVWLAKLGTTREQCGFQCTVCGCSSSIDISSQCRWLFRGEG